MISNKISASLIISTYNWKEALSLCLESALKQTVLPYEIIIADDGSRNDTKELINHYQSISPVAIKHIWHEDQGFRLTTIRNKVILASGGTYIIQIDGDILLDKNFVKDHLEVAKVGAFVCGSRVSLSQKCTDHILSSRNINKARFSGGLGYIFNELRSKIVRSYLASRYGQKEVHRLRGCNMAFWKEDLFAVNGYNEQLTFWGHEDTELAYRLLNYGIKKRFLKMGGVAYHLWHPKASRENEQVHLNVVKEIKHSGRYWCVDGLNKYLGQ